MGAFVKLAFAKTAFSYLEQQLPNLDMASYRRRVLAEYKAIVARTPSVGTMRDNMFAMTMYAGAFFIALYKTEPEQACFRNAPGVVVPACRNVLVPGKGRKGDCVYRGKVDANELEPFEVPSQGDPVQAHVQRNEAKTSRDHHPPRNKADDGEEPPRHVALVHAAPACKPG